HRLRKRHSYVFLFSCGCANARQALASGRSYGGHKMSNSYFQSDLLSEFDRLHQQVASLFGGFPYSVRSDRYGAFPQLNVGSTDDTVEIVAFVPGVQADQLNVSIDKGVLT